MKNAQAEVDKLLTELHVIQYRDLKIAYRLKQMAFILARKLFGENSPHAIAISNASFIPPGIIYNAGHQENKYAWELGIRNLRNALEGMKYEVGLIAPKLFPPQKMTFRWLIDHVPTGGWVMFLGLLGGAFSLGVWLEKHFKIAP